MAIGIVAKLNVAPGKEAEFEAVMLDLIAQVRANEPDNQLYTLCKDAEGRYVVMELYTDAAAIETHGRSDHFRAAGKRFAGLMAGAPDIQRMEVIG
ncbi:MAG: putative quinol monooxygenase [Pseudomonadales bacterium]|jgi:quinol monooxygenase YgiN